ncbi:MAG TPA: hypothetical protein VFQ65_07445 [Kofleriaceae bacterium]|nr:hypothetical protein [Kofleriaceae bacterium]
MRAVVVCVLVSVATAARATPSEAIVVSSTDPDFSAAVADALRGAGMSVVTVTDAPAPTVADLAGDSRRLADREHASATIALLAGDQGTTLLAYDRDADRVLVRPLPYRTPLGDARAAEVARMARAMLRALRVTPEIDAPPPRVAEAALLRSRAVALATAPPPVVAPVPDQLALELLGGVRIGSDGGALEHGALAIILRPDAPGLELSAIASSAATVAMTGFAGSLSDRELALTGRVPLHLAPRFVLAGQAGFGIHRIAIAGTTPAQTPAATTRYDPAVRAGVTAGYELRPGIALGVAVTADGLLRRQDFTVGGRAVASVPIVQIGGGLSLVAVLL